MWWWSSLRFGALPERVLKCNNRLMPTRASKRKRPGDTNQLAWQIVQEATGQAEAEADVPDTRNQAAVALSKLGASKGGRSRADKLSPRQRKQIAKKAAKARWAKKLT